ncbi:MAG: hypothetical protein ACW963_01005 [Candidatus Sifarchaeia archaeon]|jgi:F-type H+-transporting ATPase subunit c
MDPEVAKYLAVGLIGALGMLGPGFALGIIGRAALQGIARNPEAERRIFINMVIIAGLSEALGIYVLILGMLVFIL